MKKFLVVFALFCALIFVAACGGGSSSGSESNNQECTPGEFKCIGLESYYCNSLASWVYDARCENDCNPSTGKCKMIGCVPAGGKTWTDKADSTMTWQNAKDYCDNLTACGYSDWHLPTISELRMLIQNCTATQTGGECGVTDSCLSSDCWNDACNGCSPDSSGKYSKLGDTDYFWSSSVRSDNSDQAWYVGFYDGYVNSDYLYYFDVQTEVRCVR